MSRDMKPRKRSNTSRRKSGGGTLIGLFVGLVIGVLVAAGVVWYIHKTPVPFSNKTPPSAPPAPQQQQQPGEVSGDQHYGQPIQVQGPVYVKWFNHDDDKYKCCCSCFHVKVRKKRRIRNRSKSDFSKKKMFFGLIRLY